MGHDTAEISRLMGVTPRTARAYIQAAREAGIATEPTDAPETARGKPTRAPKRKAPRAFKRRNQPQGSVLPPILLDAPPRGSLGGFGVAPVTVSGAALGPSVPIGGHDERGRVKLSEQVIDLGTTAEHDARRYDSGRNDESWDDLEVPDDARRMVVIREDGSRTEFDLADL